MKTIISKKPSMNSAVHEVSLISEKLSREGVQTLGSETSMLIVIPATKIFNTKSMTLGANAYPILDHIVDLFQYYETSVVEVNGFAHCDECDKDHDAKVMAEARAQVVADYLWNRGIDANFIYTKVRDLQRSSSEIIALNNCIVINFRKLSKSH